MFLRSERFVQRSFADVMALIASCRLNNNSSSTFVAGMFISMIRTRAHGIFRKVTSSWDLYYLVFSSLKRQVKRNRICFPSVWSHSKQDSKEDKCSIVTEATAEFSSQLPAMLLIARSCVIWIRTIATVSSSPTICSKDASLNAT